jgi:hypothetical protein
MKRIIIMTLILLMSGSFSGCKDEAPDPSDVMVLAPSVTELEADGKSTLKFVASIPAHSRTDKRDITFRASKGSFENATGKDLVLKADQHSASDKLSCTATYIAPLDTGQAYLYGSIGSYKDSAAVHLTYVAVDKIKVQADAFAVEISYGSEINLTAQLSSKKGGMVSKGNKVRFVDTTLDGAPINGSFRKVSDLSDNASSVSCVYSPGLVPPGNFIYLKVIAVDGSGHDLPPRDSVKIYLNP